jgi:hypothetical protein
MISIISLLVSNPTKCINALNGKDVDHFFCKETFGDDTKYFIEILSNMIIIIFTVKKLLQKFKEFNVQKIEYIYILYYPYILLNTKHTNDYYH